jgi:hypothetical protein
VLGSPIRVDSRTRNWTLAGFLTVLVTTGCSTAAKIADAPPPLPRSVAPISQPARSAAPGPRILRALERVAVGSAGKDSPPTRMMAVRARNHAQAERYMMGDIVQGGHPVFVVEMRGHFTCNGCSVPAGASAPTGTVMTVILDARSLRETDFGLSRHWKNLNVLGQPISL